MYTVAACGGVAGRTVAVFGTGPTGQNAIAVARAMGAARVIAVAGTPAHAALAARMGATDVIDRQGAACVCAWGIVAEKLAQTRR